MPEDNSEPSEREPLLANAGSATSYLESGSSTIGPLPNGVEGHQHSKGIVNATQQDGDTERQQPEEAREAQFKGMPEVKKQMKYILPAIGIGIFLTAADQTIVVASYGRMGSDLHSLNNTSWIATAYFLTLTSFQPLYGKLSDIFGRKACLLFAYTVFGFGCLFCGLAGSMEQLITARAIAGIGGGGMTTVTSIMMSDIIPLRERGTWQGIVNIIFSFGSATGAPIGGVFADTIGWRWSFLGQVPLCIMAFIAVAFTLKLPSTDKDHWKAKLRKIDFPGAVILVFAVTALLLGLDHGSNVSWNSPFTLAFLALVIPASSLFILVELKYASNPFAPGRIIFDRSMFAAYLLNFFSMAGWFGLMFYLPLYYQAVDAVSASQAGLRLLPAIASTVTGSLLGGLIIQKTGKYYWLTAGCEFVFMLASIPMVLFTGTISNSTLGLSIGLAVGGLTAGAGITTSLIALISNAEPSDQAIATACSYLFRSLGSVLGLSVLSAVVQAQLRARLHEALGSGAAAEEIVRNVRESLDYIAALEPGVAEVVRSCYGKSIRDGFAVVVEAAGMGAVASFFLREKKLSE